MLEEKFGATVASKFKLEFKPGFERKIEFELAPGVPANPQSE